jgi:hypothetical protein
MRTATKASPSYEFRPDFSALAHAVVDKWLPEAADLTFEVVNHPSTDPVECGTVQEDGTWLPDDTGPSSEIVDDYHAIVVDDTDDDAPEISSETQQKAWPAVQELFRRLTPMQNDADQGIAPVPFDLPQGREYVWNKETAFAEAEKLYRDIIEGEAEAAREAAQPPIDVDKAVRRAAEFAAKQRPPLDVGPGAVAYATDCLKSKIERDVVYNPITTAHSALHSYRFFKEKRGGEVVYLDRYKRRQDASPQPAIKRAAKRLPSAIDGVTIGRNADWTDVGGILAKMRDHVLATAPYPNRPLAAMSALATLSAVCGSRVFSPTGLTLALYLVMLADTGEGKDAALKTPSRFLHSANLGLMAQPGKTFTVSGFEQCLIDSQGACIATCDEIGDSLLKKVLSKKAMPSETAIKTFLMELSGQQDDSPPFALTKRAANGVDGKNIVHTIPGASFTLFGASTPAAFYEALTYGNVGDGSLNRFLIISADRAPDDENIVDCIVPVPQSIRDALKSIAGTPTGMKIAEGRVWPLIESERAGWDDGALERYKLLGVQMRAVGRSKPQFGELYARVKANALKVATLLAVSRAVESCELLVTVVDIEKGAAMALESATVTIDGALKHMAGSTFEDNCKTILKAVNESDDKGVTHAKLHAKPSISKIAPRDFKEAVEFLVRTCQVEAKEHSKRKGQFRYIKLGDRVAVEDED